MGLFDKKPELTIKRSKYFNDRFYSNKIVKIDDSIEYFIRKAYLTLPKDPIFMVDFKQWKLGEDEFEEILMDGDAYKLLYDKTNDTFYFMQKVHSGADQNSASAPAVKFGVNEYQSWSGAMNITEKNEVLSIFNREISREADEYLFVELTGSRGVFKETWWVAVIIQPNLIK